jgi:hypothetical protein
VVVPVETLSNIFSAHKVTAIQFLKVDVEGFEYEVLEGNDWSKYRPEIICIESNHIVKDWHGLLEKNGYKKAFFDGLNEYFVSKEAFYRVELFKKAFPELLVSAPILSQDWAMQIEKLAERLDAVQRTLDDQTEANKVLNAQLASMKFLGRHFVGLMFRKLSLRKRSRDL